MKNLLPEPPGIFLRFFRWYCHPSLRNAIEGDLMELYNERCHTFGKRAADRQFIIDVLLLCRPGIIRPTSFAYHNPYAMYIHYIKTGVRSMLKNKAFSAINIFGLAVAMSVCMLIMLMLADQRAYDQFHENKSRIYRVLADQPDYKSPYATTPYPLAAALQSTYEGVDKATQLMLVAGDVAANDHTAEVHGYFADEAFFKVFSFSLDKGNPAHALNEPSTIVLSQHYARALFGDNDPLGKTLEFSDRSGAKTIPWGTFTVSGVIDTEPYRSHIKFDVLISAATRKVLQRQNYVSDLGNNWEDHFQCYTYVLLQPGKDQQHLQAALQNIAARQYRHIPEHKDFSLIAQKLTEITPGILTGNEMFYAVPRVAYYFLGGFVALIMLSACLNYISLTTARALTRAREIGVRKVTGAFRRNLVMQFLSESVLTALFALFMAMILLILIKPAFKDLWVNRYLNFELDSSPQVYIAFVTLAIVVGLIAGVYPALRLSAFRPVQALKSMSTHSRGGWGVKKTLNVTQFVISIFFITTSVLVYNQFRRFSTFDYGFNPQYIVNMPLQGNDYHKMAAAVQTVSGALTVSASDIIPATGTNNTIGLRRPDSNDEYTVMSIIHADGNFTNNLGVPLVAGRNLPDVGDTSRFVVINEAAAKQLGYAHPADAIGKEWEANWGRGTVQIAGVVKNFSSRGPMQEDAIKPLMLRNSPREFAFLQIRVASVDPMRTVERIKTVWENIDAAHPFRYEFYDDQLAAMNEGVFDVVSIIGFLAFLAIIIACLGLLGMVIYTAERRRKEIGIRRVLGAPDHKIALLLSAEFLVILGIAVAIGTPISYSINALWLLKLPNHVSFSWQTVSVALLFLLVPALVTIATQTLRAMASNPANVLRSE